VGAVILLVQKSPATLDRHRRDCLGVLSSPRRFYYNVDGWRWAADNDAFSGFDADRYGMMLDAVRVVDGCLFVTAPDVVGDWEDTRDLWDEWRHELVGLPAAYVIQDGQPFDWVPWDEMAALFVGGTDQWKMGEPARRLVAEANRRGLWTHMGRVNGHRRLRYAKAIGCDSVDGSSFSWFQDRWLEEFLDHAAAPTQLLIEGSCA
jgi:hypothetical protein